MEKSKVDSLIDDFDMILGEEQDKGLKDIILKQE